MDGLIARNLAAVRSTIAAACRRTGREAAEVRLVAVTKSADPEAIRSLVRLGQIDVAENRVQQLTARAALLGCDLDSPFEGPASSTLPRWHMVGHLQRNNVKSLLEFSRAIHSLDSDRLAEELERQAAKLDASVDVFMELNVGGEAAKTGAAADDAARLAELIERQPHLRLRGLMTMAPLEGGVETARPCFAWLRETLAQLRRGGAVSGACRELSMGMSGDLEVAIEEGATIVRVGTALFSPGPESPAIP
jgi:pyridoxal phosphate enzyme (YggS family)